MSMQDVLQALMQTSSGTQSQSGGADPLAQALGGIVGGGQSSGGMGGLLGGLLGGGGQSSGGAAATQIIGALQQIIGAQTGSGQAMPATATPLGGTAAANDPIMTLLQPVVNSLAAKAGISPAIATVIVSIALKYLLQSHPSTPGASPLDLGGVMQQLASGGSISPNVLQSSGMVSDVVKATGLDQAQATRTLTQTFNVLGSQVGKGTRAPSKPAAKKSTTKKAPKKRK